MDASAATNTVAPSQKDSYAHLVRNLPPPTREQIENFVHRVTNSHSWYKHLPATSGSAFIVYLSPTAGMRTALLRERSDNSQAKWRDYTEDDGTRFHYTWCTTSEYRRKFGYLQYTMSESLPKVEDIYGNTYTVPAEVMKAGTCLLSACCHGSCTGYGLFDHFLEAFQERVKTIERQNPCFSVGAALAALSPPEKQDANVLAAPQTDNSTRITVKEKYSNNGRLSKRSRTALHELVIMRLDGSSIRVSVPDEGMTVGDVKRELEIVSGLSTSSQNLHILEGGKDKVTHQGINNDGADEGLNSTAAGLSLASHYGEALCSDLKLTDALIITDGDCVVKPPVLLMVAGQQAPDWLTRWDNSIYAACFDGRHCHIQSRFATRHEQAQAQGQAAAGNNASPTSPPFAVTDVMRDVIADFARITAFNWLSAQWCLGRVSADEVDVDKAHQSLRARFTRKRASAGTGTGLKVGKCGINWDAAMRKPRLLGNGDVCALDFEWHDANKGGGSILGKGQEIEKRGVDDDIDDSGSSDDNKQANQKTKKKTKMEAQPEGTAATLGVKFVYMGANAAVIAQHERELAALRTAIEAVAQWARNPTICTRDQEGKKHHIPVPECQVFSASEGGSNKEPGLG